VSAGAYRFETDLDETRAKGKEAFLHLTVREPLVETLTLTPTQKVPIWILGKAAHKVFV